MRGLHTPFFAESTTFLGIVQNRISLDATPAPSYRCAMHIVHVHVRVKPEFVEAFKEATVENARHSVQEPGVARFEALQQTDDPSRFVLIEHYREPTDQAAHRETAHYLKWRDAVAPMMAEPRTPAKFTAVYPK